jgi:hypothetical protein
MPDMSAATQRKAHRPSNAPNLAAARAELQAGLDQLDAEAIRLHGTLYSVPAIFHRWRGITRLRTAASRPETRDTIDDLAAFQQRSIVDEMARATAGAWPDLVLKLVMLRDGMNRDADTADICQVELSLVGSLLADVAALTAPALPGQPCPHDLTAAAAEGRA